MADYDFDALQELLKRGGGQNPFLGAPAVVMPQKASPLVGGPAVQIQQPSQTQQPSPFVGAPAISIPDVTSALDQPLPPGVSMRAQPGGALPEPPKRPEGRGRDQSPYVGKRAVSMPAPSATQAPSNPYIGQPAMPIPQAMQPPSPAMQQEMQASGFMPAPMDISLGGGAQLPSLTGRLQLAQPAASPSSPTLTPAPTQTPAQATQGNLYRTQMFNREYRNAYGSYGDQPQALLQGDSRPFMPSKLPPQPNIMQIYNNTGAPETYMFPETGEAQRVLSDPFAPDARVGPTTTGGPGLQVESLRGDPRHPENMSLAQTLANQPMNNLPMTPQQRQQFQDYVREKILEPAQMQPLKQGMMQAETLQGRKELEQQKATHALQIAAVQNRANVLLGLVANGMPIRQAELAADKMAAIRDQQLGFMGLSATGGAGGPGVAVTNLLGSTLSGDRSGKSIADLAGSEADMPTVSDQVTALKALVGGSPDMGAPGKYQAIQGWGGSTHDPNVEAFLDSLSGQARLIKDPIAARELMTHAENTGIKGTDRYSLINRMMAQAANDALTIRGGILGSTMSRTGSPTWSSPDFYKPIKIGGLTVTPTPEEGSNAPAGYWVELGNQPARFIPHRAMPGLGGPEQARQQFFANQAGDKERRDRIQALETLINSVYGNK